MMKNRIKIIILPLMIFSLIIFSACSSPSCGDTATISISFNNDSATDKAAVNIDQLRHVITLTGPTGTQTLSITGSGTAKASVVAGTWQIEVEAFLGSDLYAEGSTTANVKAGRNTNVTVFMNVVWTPPGGGGGGGGGRTTRDPWDFAVSGWEELYGKVLEINAAGGGTKVILLTQDLFVDITTPAPNGWILIDVPATDITLMANSPITIKRAPPAAGAGPGGGYVDQFFKVTNGKLTLGYPGMSGTLSLVGDTGGYTEIIEVSYGGALVMNEGVKLSGNERTGAPPTLGGAPVLSV